MNLSGVGRPSAQADAVTKKYVDMTFEDCRVRATLFDFLLKAGIVSFAAYSKHQYIWDN